MASTYIPLGSSVKGLCPQVFSASLGAQVSFYPSGIILDVNPVVEEITGMSRDGLRGKSISVLFPDFKPPTSMTRNEELFSRVNMLNKDGNLFPVDLRVTECNSSRKRSLFISQEGPLFEPGLSKLPFSSSSQEATKSLDERETPEWRREFVLLNDALGNNINALGMVLNSESESPLELLEKARKQFELLSMNYETHLEKTRILMRESRVERAVFEFAPFINEICEPYRTKFQGKGEFTVLIKQDVPVQINNDKEKIRFILKRLLKKAINSTENGYIRVSIFSELFDQLFLKVEYSGKGIDQRLLNGALDGRPKCSPETARRRLSIGEFDLSTSNDLAHLIGGNLTGSSSSTSLSTTFTLSIPLLPVFTSVPMHTTKVKEMGNEFLEKFPPSPVLPVSAMDVANTEKKAILLVDDDPTTPLVVRKKLPAEEYECDIASDGQEALQKLAKKNYDAIVMDVMMPVMNGVETAKRIRLLEDIKKRSIPIIGNSASVEERDRCLEAGMTDFVAKPIDMSKLLEVLRRVLRIQS